MRTDAFTGPTLLDLLDLRAVTNADVGYSFVAGSQSEISLTYAEIAGKAKQVAALIQRHAAPGDRVLLLYQPGLDFIFAFFGCLYAGIIAVPAFPPRFNRNLSRVRTICDDAEPRLVLSTTQVISSLAPACEDETTLKDLLWLNTDEEIAGVSEAALRPTPVEAGTIALLQYTSGSTARPNGVMLSHANLLHNSKLIAENFECTPDGIGVSWLPPYHDMGLIGGILQPMYVGGPMVLTSPFSFLQHPIRWLEIISRCKGRATLVSGGPTFAYDLCVRRTTPEQRESLDLSHWDLAFVGAEPVRADTLRRFSEAFEVSGFHPEAFYPCYGLAEATLMVSGGNKKVAPIVKRVMAEALEQNVVVDQNGTGSEHIRQVVGNGRTLGGQRIVIADPTRLTLSPPNTVGEIWVAGPSVARGYWGDNANNATTFGAFLSDSGDGPFLRTGDLGFFRDGELFVTGRIKDLIIIDGRNHYPQDIELTVERSHRAIRPGGCAAFAIETGSQERLAILAEIENRYMSGSHEEITKLIRQEVAENHGVRPFGVKLVKGGSIPRTSSGKIQRYQCRRIFSQDIQAA